MGRPPTGRRATYVFANLRKHEKWEIFTLLAHEYVRAAQAGLRDIARDKPRERHGALCLFPVLHLMHHAIELFLKGAILWNTRQFPTTHDIESLAASYNDGVAKSELKFDRNIMAVLLRWDREAVGNSSVRPLSGSTFRYLFSKNLDLLMPGFFLPVRQVVDLVNRCDKEFARIHVLMVQSRSPKPDAHLVHPLKTWWEPDAMFGARCRRARIGHSEESPEI